MGYETNKFERKADVEAGGWHVGWADDIRETDVAAGLVAAGISIHTGNPAAFLAWVDHLVDRTWMSLANDLAGLTVDGAVHSEAKQLAAVVIRNAVQGKSAEEVLKPFSNVAFKAGAINYSGKNTFDGRTLTRTWGLKPYVAFRIRTPAGNAEAPTTSDRITDVPPPISINVYTTDAIIGYVNDSHAIRLFVTPVYVRINSIDAAHDIHLVGGDIDNPNVEDPEHSKIIRRMATVALTLGKQLRIESATIDNWNMYVKAVAIIEDA